jgi:hypothetical protein
MCQPFHISAAGPSPAFITIQSRSPSIKRLSLTGSALLRAAHRTIHATVLLKNESKSAKNTIMKEMIEALILFFPN